MLANKRLKEKTKNLATHNKRDIKMKIKKKKKIFVNKEKK